jgi:hypothetical protein
LNLLTTEDHSLSQPHALVNRYHRQVCSGRYLNLSTSEYGPLQFHSSSTPFIFLSFSSTPNGQAFRDAISCPYSFWAFDREPVAWRKARTPHTFHQSSSNPNDRASISNNPWDGAGHCPDPVSPSHRNRKYLYQRSLGSNSILHIHFPDAKKVVRFTQRVDLNSEPGELCITRLLSDDARGRVSIDHLVYLFFAQDHLVEWWY